MTEAEKLAILDGGTAQEKSRVLYIVLGSRMSPTLASAVERCLLDDTVVRMYIPYKYGPLRILAADVLSWYRASTGDLRPIVLRSVPPALSIDGIRKIQQAVGISGGRGDPTMEYQDLYQRDALKRIDEIFDPGLYS